jgi:hypothetical protein
MTNLRIAESFARWDGCDGGRQTPTSRHRKRRSGVLPAVGDGRVNVPPVLEQVRERDCRGVDDIVILPKASRAGEPQPPQRGKGGARREVGVDG